LKIASIHSKMINSFPDDWNTAEPIQIETIISIQDALGGKKMSYSATPNTNNKQGLAEGVLVGGNLKTLETLSGTASDINTNGKILFVEDTGEYLYSIDRMFWNLKRTGKLKGLKALIVGGFRVKPDDPGEEFGKTIEDIVLEKVSGYNYPVCFDFPVGHQMNNFALKCGVKHRLLVKENEVSLSEIL
ncbi:MAG: S66 peptidase family protein, partial [Flavisolibacter sp.]